MTPTEINVQDAVDQLAELEAMDAQREVLKPNPTVLVAIVATALEAVKDEEKPNLDLALYLTVKGFVKGISNTTRMDNYVGAVFAYYVEAHRAIQHLEAKTNNTPENPKDPLHLAFYKKATLSIFDLYLVRPYDSLVRRLVSVAAASLHEVATVHQSSDEDKNMGDIIGYLSTIALLAQTTSAYVRGIRRKRNYAYIAWLKTFLDKVTSTQDLSFMKDDKDLAKIVDQVTNRAPHIVVS